MRINQSQTFGNTPHTILSMSWVTYREACGKTIQGYQQFGDESKILGYNKNQHELLWG